jgi:hypothetical protein
VLNAEPVDRELHLLSSSSGTSSIHGLQVDVRAFIFQAIPERAHMHVLYSAEHIFISAISGSHGGEHDVAPCIMA